MNAMNFNFLRDDPLPPNGRRVAIIGAGPSGLAAAGYLGGLGYQVDAYDKLPSPGGLMTFGIPSHRIPSERIDAGVRILERRLGVNFHCATKVCCSAPLHEEEGDHFSAEMIGLGELVDDHDAVLICTGAWKSRKPGLPGEVLPGVYSGLEFLFPIRAARYARPDVTVPKVEGKRVAVIGAGHSAMDAAHSANHLGAAEVSVVYRRTRNDAPCGTFEIDRLEELGIRWMEKTSPLEILGDDHVEGMRVSGPEGESVLDVDVVIYAIGEIPTPPFAGKLGLENIRKGDVRWLNMTSIDNVFVAGDVLSGPSKVGKAVESGLKAARSLANWLDLKGENREAEFHGSEKVGR
ncbi:FAD-dependent oxidoreductase [Salidesulfovibrio brasiliensis]|uniref:FAD-dependent oxidoreductase n=1 Tax=Salidesulfovibrio brasiliensis TaxID=221711 RepID=UPI0006CFEFF0|nr:FAD-dependent oxidoreductase [Salidesulfovibrio brasiliensis]